MKKFIDQVSELVLGLRNRGYLKQAEVLEDKFFEYKTAETHLYKVFNEEGEDVVDRAHPDGDLEIGEACCGHGYIETQTSQHKKILDMIKKNPTGKFASRDVRTVSISENLLNDLLSVAKIYGLDQVKIVAESVKKGGGVSLFSTRDISDMLFELESLPGEFDWDLFSEGFKVEGTDDEYPEESFDEVEPVLTMKDFAEEDRCKLLLKMAEKALIKSGQDILGDFEKMRGELIGSGMTEGDVYSLSDKDLRYNWQLMHPAVVISDKQRKLNHLAEMAGQIISNPSIQFSKIMAKNESSGDLISILTLYEPSIYDNYEKAFMVPKNYEEERLVEENKNQFYKKYNAARNIANEQLDINNSVLSKMVSTLPDKIENESLDLTIFDAIKSFLKGLPRTFDPSIPLKKIEEIQQGYSWRDEQIPSQKSETKSQSYAKPSIKSTDVVVKKYDKLIDITKQKLKTKSDDLKPGYINLIKQFESIRSKIISGNLDLTSIGISLESGRELDHLDYIADYYLQQISKTASFSLNKEAQDRPPTPPTPAPAAVPIPPPPPPNFPAPAAGPKPVAAPGSAQSAGGSSGRITVKEEERDAVMNMQFLMTELASVIINSNNTPASPENTKTKAEVVFGLEKSKLNSYAAKLQIVNTERTITAGSIGDGLWGQKTANGLKVIEELIKAYNAVKENENKVKGAIFNGSPYYVNKSDTVTRAEENIKTIMELKGVISGSVKPKKVDKDFGNVPLYAEKAHKGDFPMKMSDVESLSSFLNFLEKNNVASVAGVSLGEGQTMKTEYDAKSGKTTQTPYSVSSPSVKR